MALTMWGQVVVQSATPGEDPVQVGTIWVDTSSTPVVKVCTAVSPYTFATAGASLSDGDKGDITVSGSGGTWTIDNDVVSDAKLRNSGALSVIGRSANSSGDPADISASAGGNDVLRESSNVLGFGKLVNANIDAAAAIAASKLAPPGADTQVLFNDGGAFGGDAGLVYDKTNNRLTTDLLTLLGGQIAFPASQNASADANTLDDYEEGTWTPVLGGTGGESGQAYSAQQGRYVKVGQLVFVTSHTDLSTEGTITGNLQISGLPFASIGSVYATGAIQWGSFATNWVNVIASIAPSATTAQILGAAAAQGNNTTALTAADVQNGSSVIFAMPYRAGA